jgi:hypothetical protein
VLIFWKVQTAIAFVCLAADLYVLGIIIVGAKLLGSRRHSSLLRCVVEGHLFQVHTSHRELEACSNATRCIHCESLPLIQNEILSPSQIALVVVDTLQGIGTASNVKWLHKQEVRCSQHCTFQGVTQVLGETGSAMMTIVSGQYFRWH